MGIPKYFADEYPADGRFYYDFDTMQACFASSRKEAADALGTGWKIELPSELFIPRNFNKQSIEEKKKCNRIIAGPDVWGPARFMVIGMFKGKIQLIKRVKSVTSAFKSAAAERRKLPPQTDFYLFSDEMNTVWVGDVPEFAMSRNLAPAVISNPNTVFFVRNCGNIVVDGVPVPAGLCYAAQQMHKMSVSAMSDKEFMRWYESPMVDGSGAKLFFAGNIVPWFDVFTMSRLELHQKYDYVSYIVMPKGLPSKRKAFPGQFVEKTWLNEDTPYFVAFAQYTVESTKDYVVTYSHDTLREYKCPPDSEDRYTYIVNAIGKDTTTFCPGDIIGNLFVSSNAEGSATPYSPHSHCYQTYYTIITYRESGKLKGKLAYGGCTFVYYIIKLLKDKGCTDIKTYSARSTDASKFHWIDQCGSVYATTFWEFAAGEKLMPVLCFLNKQEYELARFGISTDLTSPETAAKIALVMGIYYHTKADSRMIDRIPYDVGWDGVQFYSHSEALLSAPDAYESGRNIWFDTPVNKRSIFLSFIAGIVNGDHDGVITKLTDYLSATSSSMPTLDDALVNGCMLDVDDAVTSALTKLKNTPVTME